MSQPSDRRRTLVFFYLAAAFSLLALWQTVRILAAGWDLTAAVQAMGDRSARLNLLVRDYRRQMDYGRELSARMDFLQGLPNLLPEQTRFVRAQNVIQEEVGTLRRRISARLARATYVLVDTKVNKLYVKKGLKLLMEANCSVGRGGLLRDKATGRGWDFTTPKGVFSVVWKTENPVWIKPDWAFVEAKQPIPPPDDPARMVEGELGGYLLSIGNGYLIHGTKDEEALGRPVSHGCVRLGAADLELVYKTVPVGARVYVY